MRTYTTGPGGKPATPDDGLLSSNDVSERAGIAYRQLDYWLRTGIVDLPSRRNTGNGNWRRFTQAEADLIVVVAAEKRDLDERFVAWSTGAFWRQLTTEQAAG